MWEIEKIIKKGDYQYCVVRNHPNKTINNYVLLHRVVVENSLGRVLRSNEIVHHKDGNKLNNDISNLEVTNVIDHSRMHGFEQNKIFVKLKCPFCKTIFDREKRQTHLVKRKNRYTACSRSCNGKLSRQFQLNGESKEYTESILENFISEYLVYHFN